MSLVYRILDACRNGLFLAWLGQVFWHLFRPIEGVSFREMLIIVTGGFALPFILVCVLQIVVLYILHHMGGDLKLWKGWTRILISVAAAVVFTLLAESIIALAFSLLLPLIT